jgi:hypothetical protein
VIEGGLRYSLYNYLGPQSVNQYPPGVPKTEDNILSVKNYAAGNSIKNYSGPEYRLSLRYEFSDNFSIKASYNTMRQYMHVLTNTTAISPTDIYKLSDPNIVPQEGSQVSLGFYKNLKNNTIETSVEVYYKKMQNIMDYKSGAILVMNHHIETEVINTRGRAYGIEFMIKKTTGKLNGWISYTYSRVQLAQDDPYAGELINNGSYYPANYDQPNSATMVANYRVNHRFSVSLNSTYTTGRPITLPTDVFYYYNSYRTLYGDRNSYRIPDYFRTDFALNIDGITKCIRNFIIHGRSVCIISSEGTTLIQCITFSENGSLNGYKLSIFGSAIPSSIIISDFENHENKILVNIHWTDCSGWMQGKFVVTTDRPSGGLLVVEGFINITGKQILCYQDLLVWIHRAGFLNREHRWK